MNRPACIKQIDQHVARARVTPYRLRAVDAKRVLDYLEHLERGHSPDRPTMSLEPEERVLGHAYGPPCVQCGTAGGAHLIGCEA